MADTKNDAKINDILTPPAEDAAIPESENAAPTTAKGEASKKTEVKKDTAAKKLESGKKGEPATAVDITKSHPPATKEFKAGDTVKLKIGVILHHTSFDTVSAPRYSGPVVIWGDKVAHGRIAITNSIEGVGDTAKILGWVDVEQLIRRSI